MNCPKCNNPIPQGQNICPNCGYSSVNEVTSLQTPQSTDNFLASFTEKLKNNKKILFALLGILLIVIISTAVFFYFRPKQASVGNTTNIERKTVDAYGKTPVAGEDYESGRIIFGLKSPLTANGQEIDAQGTEVKNVIGDEALIKIFQKYKTEKIFKPFAQDEIFKNVYIASFAKEENALHFMTELQMNPDVEFAEPDYYAKLQYVPQDPYFSSKGSWGQDYDDMWNLKLIDMPKAWDITRGDKSVKVGVVDSGIDHTHPDLEGNVHEGYSGIIFLNKGYSGDCFETHGTHVAGIIGAKENNSGVVGVSPNVSLYPYSFIPCKKIPPDQKVDLVGKEKKPEDSLPGLTNRIGSTAIALLITKAYDTDMDIINLSMGFGHDSYMINKIVNHSVKNGKVFVTAAGNESENASLSSPSNNPNAIVVSATDYNDNIAPYSNFGSTITVSAPGGDNKTGDILSTGSTMVDFSKSRLAMGDKYIRLAGTSMAAPHVAGLAALVKSLHPDWSSKRIKCAIILGAEDKGDVGWDEKFGYGRINAYNTLILSEEQVTEDCIPIADIINPITNSGHEIGASVEITGTAIAKDLDSWKLEYLSEGQNVQNGWQIIKQDSTRVEKGALSGWSTDSLKQGNYQLRLTVYDKDGKFAVDEASIYLYNKISDGEKVKLEESSPPVNSSDRAFNMWFDPKRTTFEYKYYENFSTDIKRYYDGKGKVTGYVESLEEGVKMKKLEYAYRARGGYGAENEKISEYITVFDEVKDEKTIEFSFDTVFLEPYAVVDEVYFRLTDTKGNVYDSFKCNRDTFNNYCPYPLIFGTLKMSGVPSPFDMYCTREGNICRDKNTLIIERYGESKDIPLKKTICYGGICD